MRYFFSIIIGGEITKKDGILRHGGRRLIFQLLLHPGPSSPRISRVRSAASAKVLSLALSFHFVDDTRYGLPHFPLREMLALRVADYKIVGFLFGRESAGFEAGFAAAGHILVLPAVFRKQGNEKLDFPLHLSERREAGFLAASEENEYESDPEH